MLMTSFEKFHGDKLSRMTYFNKFHGHPHNHENLCQQVSSFKECGQYVNLLNKTAEGNSLNYYQRCPTQTPTLNFISNFIFYKSIFHHRRNSPVRKPPNIFGIVRTQVLCRITYIENPRQQKLGR